MRSQHKSCVSILFLYPSTFVNAHYGYTYFEQWHATVILSLQTIGTLGQLELGRLNIEIVE